MLTVEPLGLDQHNQLVNRYCLSNANGFEVCIINLGATITHLWVPDTNGQLTDVVLGYDKLSDYQTDQACMGAIAGRVANRIAQGKMTIDGAQFQLEQNNGDNHLHGGSNGFNRQYWQANGQLEPSSNSLSLTYVSPDGDQGYPGKLTTQVRYTITDDNQLIVEFEANSDKDTVVNLTSHVYFNLSGHQAKDCLTHQLQLHCQHYYPLDNNQLPLQKTDVANTAFDFTQPVTLAKALAQDDPQLKLAHGLDHYFEQQQQQRTTSQLNHLATLTSNDSGISLRLLSTEPGLQCYSANFLAQPNGKAQANYSQHAGLCLETHKLPNAINRAESAAVQLKKQTSYHTQTHFCFSLNQQNKNNNLS